jgi:ABC-type xylose transport system substrate-binding protein
MENRTGKSLVAIATAALVTVASGAFAQAPKGLVGTWKLDLAKSTFSPGPAPKSMTITYTAEGTDGIKIAVDVATTEGAAQHWEMTAHYDGKDYPVTGNPMADTISLKRIDDRTGESTFKKDGKVTATNTRMLSADGKTLTITSTGTTADGKPRKDVQVFER